MTNRVIRGTYSDFKLVKGRSVAQIVVEVPIEQGQSVVDMFGLPQPSEELWVAIAALEKVAVEKSEEAIEAIKMAGIFCKDPQFGVYLIEHRGMRDLNPNDPEMIANALRAILGVKSRADMQHDEGALTAFRRLRTEYEEHIAGM